MADTPPSPKQLCRSRSVSTEPWSPDDLLSDEERLDVGTQRFFAQRTGVGHVSVTDLIGTPFQPFNGKAVVEAMDRAKKAADYPGLTDQAIVRRWQQTGREAANAGNVVHRIIDKWLQYGTQNTSLACKPEWDAFQQFMASATQARWEVFRAEAPLVLTNAQGAVLITGQVDLILRQRKGLTEKWRYAVVDWKRSDVHKGPAYNHADVAGFTHLADTKLTRYTLQVYLYRHILRTAYHLDIAESDVFLVGLLPGAMCVPVEVDGVLRNPLPLPNLALEARRLVEQLEELRPRVALAKQVQRDVGRWSSVAARQ